MEGENMEEKIEIIENWNGKPIKVERSKGKKLAVIDYMDNLIISSNSIWPHFDILKKIYKSNHEKDFDNSKIRQKLGFYCDLQSLTSEDAITWSVFGTLNYFSKEEKIKFVQSLFKHLNLKPKVNDCLIGLWTKIMHPDTQKLGGPELDFLIISDSIVLLGESKWGSKISENQGENKNKDQIQLRLDFKKKYAKKIFKGKDCYVLLIVKDQSDAKKFREIYKIYKKECRISSWKKICNDLEHPLKDELIKYYEWKIKMDKLNQEIV